MEFAIFKKKIIQSNIIFTSKCSSIDCYTYISSVLIFNSDIIPFVFIFALYNLIPNLALSKKLQKYTKLAKNSKIRSEQI